MNVAGKQAVAVASRLKLAAGVSIAGTAFLIAPGPPPLEAKAPGVTHCYRSVCHRVRSVEQTRQLVGRTLIVDTSFYDMPGIDRFNTGVFTSNGERFNAGDPGRVASADLPDGTELLIRNPVNGRVSHVRVNDFGPFRGNRRLDVTRRVAEDLDFKHKGVVKLEVTVIAPPQEEDLRYRRNRPPRPTTGHLGVVFDAEVPELVARLVAERGTPEAAPVPTASVVAAAEPLPLIDAAAAPAQPHHSPAVSAMPAADEEANALAVAAIENAPSEQANEPSAVADTAVGFIAALTNAPAEENPPAEAIAMAELPQIASALSDDNRNGIEPVSIATEAQTTPVWGYALAQTGISQGDSSVTLSAPLSAALPAGLAVSSLALTAASVAQLLPLQHLYLVLVLLLLSSALFALHATAARAPALSRNAAQPRADARGSANAIIARVATEPVQTPAASMQQVAPASATSASKTPAEASPPPSTSVIGPEMTIEGTVKTLGRLIVSGTIRGRVEALELVLTRTGMIEGEINAKTVQISGAVRGRIEADAISFDAGSTCWADVIAATISVDSGAVVEGAFSRPRH